jgi:cold shock CspA family protein
MAIMVGNVQKFDMLRGYGFIMKGFRNKIFFHVTQWKSDIAPKIGMLVTYDLVPARKPGFEHQAANVKPVESGLNEEQTEAFVLALNGAVQS